MKNKVYAVVDLETTGNKLTEDKIIQFSCVFVEKENISHQFSTFINPQMPIPEHIQELTGISYADVKKAPIIEDIAPILHGLLEDCVFVAHNVNFDLKFLNHVFDQFNLPPLNNQAIDTVELTQICYPMLNSFKLNDLADYFSYRHDQPHRADSDALVTAHLFIQLMQRIQKLPEDVLILLFYLSKDCTLSTGIWLQQKIKSMLPQKLLETQYSYDLIAKHLEKISIGLKERITTYQNKMYDDMTKTFVSNSVFQQYILEFLMQKGQSMCIQIDIDKSFKQILSTKGYQLYLVSDDISDSLLADLCIYSKKHYVKLSHVQEELQKEHNHRMEAIYKMAVLVWLTETQTGNLDELSKLSNHQIFWQSIRHDGQQDYLYWDIHTYYLDLIGRKKTVLISYEAFLEEELMFDQVVDALFLMDWNQFLSFYDQYYQYSLDFYQMKQYKKLIHILVSQFNDLSEVSVVEVKQLYECILSDIEQIKHYVHMNHYGHRLEDRIQGKQLSLYVMSKQKLVYRYLDNIEQLIQLLKIIKTSSKITHLLSYKIMQCIQELQKHKVYFYELFCVIEESDQYHVLCDDTQFIFEKVFSVNKRDMLIDKLKNYDKVIYVINNER